MIPMRVDFAGGWLDVPKLAMPGSYIVNCAITPGLEYPYQHGAGIGGSAAAAISQGKDPFESELKIAGWQDPAVILETGLCVWRSGDRPVLQCKVNPDFLTGRMALWWTGHRHVTHDLLEHKRDYERISYAGMVAATAVTSCLAQPDLLLYEAIRRTYQVQIDEGMEKLPPGGVSKKYLGAGHGGYALYIFTSSESRDMFVREAPGVAIEPYLKPIR